MNARDLTSAPGVPIPTPPTAAFRTPLPLLVSVLRTRPWWLFAALYFLLSAPFVGHYPIPSGDEVIGNDPAAEWILHGHIQSSLFGELPGFERGYFLQPPSHFLTLAGFYAVAGVSIITTRIHELLWAALAFAMWGELAVAWTGSRRAGLLTAALIACIPPLGHSIAAARMDAQALALIAISLWLWIPAPGAISRHPFIAGFFLGFAGLTHPIIIFWAAGLLVGGLVSSRERRRSLGWLIAGAAVPFAGWMIYAAANWIQFTHQFLAHGRGKLGGPGVLALAGGELHRTITSFAQQPLLPFLYIGGAWSWWRRYSAKQDFRRETSAFAGVVILGVMFGLEKNSGPHLLYHATLLSLGAAAMLDATLATAQPNLRWLRRIAGAALVVVLAIGAIRWTLPRAVALGPQRVARDHEVFAREISKLIPPGSNVAGEPVAYYAVREAGGWLRLAVPPDPRRHQFVISSARAPWQMSADFENIATVGQPLPRWLGRTFSPSEELYVVVARSRLTAVPPK